MSRWDAALKREWSANRPPCAGCGQPMDYVADSHCKTCSRRLADGVHPARLRRPR